jgi:hypothetical protein
VGLLVAAVSVERACVQRVLLATVVEATEHCRTTANESHLYYYYIVIRPQQDSRAHGLGHSNM